MSASPTGPRCAVYDPTDVYFRDEPHESIAIEGNNPSVVPRTLVAQEPKIIFNSMSVVSMLFAILVSPPFSKLWTELSKEESSPLQKLQISVQAYNCTESGWTCLNLLNSTLAWSNQALVRTGYGQNGDQLHHIKNALKLSYQEYCVQYSPITILFQASVAALVVLENLYKDKPLALPTIKKMNAKLINHLIKNGIEPIPTCISTYLLTHHKIDLKYEKSTSIKVLIRDSSYTRPAKVGLSPSSPYIPNNNNDLAWSIIDLQSTVNQLNCIMENCYSPKNITTKNFYKHLLKTATQYTDSTHILAIHHLSKNASP